MAHTTRHEKHEYLSMNGVMGWSGCFCCQQRPVNALSNAAMTMHTTARNSYSPQG